MRVVAEIGPHAALLHDEALAGTAPGRERMVRGFLEERLGIAPEAIALATMRGGRRWLPSRPEMTFNWSRRGSHLLVAVLPQGRVGVDLEALEETVDVLGTAAVAFAPAECARLAALAGPARLDAFYRLWCAREAWLKALGLGIDGPEAAELDLAGWMDDPAAPVEGLGSRGDIEARRLAGAGGEVFYAAVARARI